jgi:3-oxoacyl-[acyl-carrier protein] reductase
VVVGDLTTEAGSAATVAAVVETMGAIDVLVNNVGAPVGGKKADWFENSVQDWADSFAVNTLAAVRMIHAFGPASTNTTRASCSPGRLD